MKRFQGQNLLAVFGMLLLLPLPVSADAAPPADFGRGALYGKVVDTATGKPVADATVALQDKKGKVVAWTRTDAQGQYAIATDSLKVLQLRPSRRRGLLARIVRGVGTVVTAPVKAVGAAARGAVGAVKQVNPVQAAKSAAITAATGNPVPVASQIAGTTLEAVTKNAEKRARDSATRAVLGERQAQPKEKRDTPVPGEVLIAVSAPGFKEAKGKAGAYWLEPPTEDKKVGTRAWLETVKLAPAASDKKSEIENVAILLAEPQLEPSLAPAGAALKLSAKLQTPGNQPMNVRVFAREDKKKRVAELKAQGNNVYAGELVLDPKTPVGETKVTILALRADPVEVNLRESKADPLLDFAQRLDEMDADKPYDFDPRIMASENRLDITLTILDPKQATPSTPAATPTPPPAPDAAPRSPETPPAPPAAPPTPAPAPAK